MSYGQDFAGQQTAQAGQGAQRAPGGQPYGWPYGQQRPWGGEQPWGGGPGGAGGAGGAGGPGYAAQPPGQRRRKRHVLRYVSGGIAGIIVVIVAISVANGGGHSVQTTGSSGGSSGASGASGVSGASASHETARIGSAISLAGNDSGEKMSVTVTKVISDATAGDEFSSPQAGDRLYAVQFRLTDTGAAAYSDAPSNGAAVVDSAGQSYQSSLDTAAGCQQFGGTENIAPGSSGLGCIVFEVPVKAKIVAVQFTLDSGFGPQTGQWDVAG